MQLTYVDESYTDGWFVMAALLVDGPEAVTLTDELDRVATAAAAYGLGVGVELHGHEIFHGGGAWKGVPVRARVGVFDDIVEAIAARDVRVIARAMDVGWVDVLATASLTRLIRWCCSTFWSGWMSVPPVSVTTHW